MADQTNNNNPFEEFFRKKAEEYDISYREQDWLDLEKKLDVRDAQISYQRKVRWIAAASILIVSVLGYFTYQNYNKINHLNQLLNEELTSQQESSTVPESPGEIRKDIPGLSEQPQETLADNQPPNSEDQNSNSIPPTKNTGEQQQPDSEPSKNQPVPSAFEEEQITVRDISSYAELKDYPETIALGNTTSQPPLDEYKAMASVQKQLPVYSPPPVSTASSVIASRFTFRLLISPDLSTTGFDSGFYEPGYKIGAAVNYQLNPKLAISTGLVHSTVRYDAQGQDYNPTTSPYNNNYNFAPNRVIAECLILDIPVNLNYEWISFDRSRIVASAGLSSYIMMSEEYDFRYDTYSPGQAESWNGKTGAFHLFSNAGFSIGYQMNVTPQWSLQVEPFIKVPLKEIGWGNIKLYSIGSFVSVNYNL